MENIINLLKDEKSIALVTDAGTPCISDPGYEVVDAALEAGIQVSPIPGASSMTAAASVAGMSMRRFAFEGFLPKKKGRQTLLKKACRRGKDHYNFGVSPQDIENPEGCEGIFWGQICCCC